MITGRELFDNLVSHAQQQGVFDIVQGFEPKTAPGNGVSAHFWLGPLTPVAEMSGLNVSSLMVEVNLRIMTPFLQQPADAIDPLLFDAAAAMLIAYSADFQLDDSVFAIDLLGAWGSRGLVGTPGYLTQDGKTFRALVITIPVVLADVIPQEA